MADLPIYRARQQFRPDGNFAAWARRIATNLALDHLRRKRPEQSLLAEPAAAPPSYHLLQRETREKIQLAFRRLPAKLQVAATLALVEEQPYEEIADALVRDICRRSEAACVPGGSHPAQTTEPPWTRARSCKDMRIRK